MSYVIHIRFVPTVEPYVNHARHGTNTLFCLPVVEKRLHQVTVLLPWLVGSRYPFTNWVFSWSLCDFVCVLGSLKSSLYPIKTSLRHSCSRAWLEDSSWPRSPSLTHSCPVPYRVSQGSGTVGGLAEESLSDELSFILCLGDRIHWPKVWKVLGWKMRVAGW